MKLYNRVLLVVKQSAYEAYLQMKTQGKAPLALRWERLKNRYHVHKACVKDVSVSILNNLSYPILSYGVLS